MASDRPFIESEKGLPSPDIDEIPIRDRKVVTQPYDLSVESLLTQIQERTIFLRPLSERPEFQRRYVWNDKLASKLVESILLKVPIPPCYLSQNEDFELDVIDGQQRLFSIFRFCENQFKLSGLDVLTEFNGLRFHEMPPRVQRQIKTHTQRCVLITNESHPEVKFEVFERLNTNTVPLTAQEIRNCVYRGPLLALLKEAVLLQDWLTIIRKNEPDRRMRDEELVLRFFAFHIEGPNGYRTPQKRWLNETAKAGRSFSSNKIGRLRSLWEKSIANSLEWFEPNECFRSDIKKPSAAINRAIFDLVMYSASQMSTEKALAIRPKLRKRYVSLLRNTEFQDLISRSVDHASRTKRRFEMWDEAMNGVI